MKWIAGFLAALAVMLLGGYALATETEEGETDMSATHNDHRKAKTNVFAAKRHVWQQMI